MMGKTRKQMKKDGNPKQGKDLTEDELKKSWKGDYANCMKHKSEIDRDMKDAKTTADAKKWYNKNNPGKKFDDKDALGKEQVKGDYNIWLDEKNKKKQNKKKLSAEDK